MTKLFYITIDPTPYVPHVSPCFSVGFALIVCKLRVELNFSSDVEMRDIPKKHDQNPWTQYHIFSKCNYISFLFFTQVFAI